MTGVHTCALPISFGFNESDHEEAKRKFFDKGKDLMLLAIGESIEI